MKIIKKIILILIVIGVLVVVTVANQGYKYYKEAISKKSILETANEIRGNENFTSIDEMPQEYIDAVIAVEDRRFYEHNGIDIISISRAVFKNIVSLKAVEGGSTITQQLAKNTYFTQSKNIVRKFAEIFMAFQYEKYCTKDEIFELYVNTSYFGDGYYCIKEAANGYFDKEPKDLNLYESTLLAGVPNAPSVYAPTKNPELAKQRQAQVIRKMIKYKYLTEEEAKDVLNINYDDYKK